MNFKTVRGMRDFLPEKAELKRWVESVCGKWFRRYGFVPIETPVVEEFKLLAKKGSGGEAIKDEIYYFKDKSGRELGLRFDLTVPTARVVAGNQQLGRPFKRYQIGRVYRYDRPQKQRYREFTQADADIFGVESVKAEFELLAMAVNILKELGIDFRIRINNRKLLEDIALENGVKKEKIKNAFRAIDKLDKIGWEGVEKELKKEKISLEFMKAVKKNDATCISGCGGAEEIEELFSLLRERKLDKFVELDLTLARGLEYYTGMVFEIASENGPSICGGGRYDKLIESYDGQPTPATGYSFGVDRLVDVLEGKKLESEVKLFIIPLGEKAGKEALKLAEKMRTEGISVETDLIGRGISKNISYADRKEIPFVGILGEDELKKGEIAVKDLKSGKQKSVSLKNMKKLAELLA